MQFLILLDFNKCYWDKCITTYRRMKLNSYAMSYIKIKSKKIKDLNGKAKTIELSEETLGLQLMTLDLVMVSSI